jgi:hypothetical protein
MAMDPQVFIDTTIAALHDQTAVYQSRGWRFVALSGTTVEQGVELLYSFSNHKEFEQLRLIVSSGETVPAISDIYFNALVFENEVHDLFGVNIEGIAIDFGGHFYAVSVPTPMNPVSAQAQSAFNITYRQPAKEAGASDKNEGGV